MTLQEQAQQLRAQWNEFVAEKDRCPEVYEFLVEYHLSRAMNSEPPWPFEFIVGAVENHRLALALGDNFQGGRTTLPTFVGKIATNPLFNYLPPYFKIENFDSRTYSKGESIADQYKDLLQENG